MSELTDTNHREDRAMNPNAVMTFREQEQADTAARGQIEDGLERLFHQQERVERAFAVLTERLEIVLHPEMPEPSDPSTADKSSTPRSPVANRLHATADDMSRLARRIESVTDRLDT